MIESILIDNFQCHTSFVLDFDSKVNCIVGSSDQGKSAILRALRWNLCNSIRGDDFITHGFDSCRVVVRIDDKKITRKIGKGGNSYQIDKEEPYKAFGSTVPESIANLLNLDESLNFQGQLDPPFWFWLSPGEVSRQLNRIVDLERIDNVLSRCAGELRQTRSNLQYAEERLTEASKERDKLAWTVQANREWEAIEVLQRNNVIKRAEIDALQSAVEEATTLASEVQMLSAAKADALALMQQLERGRKLAEEIAAMCEAVEEAEEACTSVQEARRELDQARKQFEQDRGKICPACGGPYVY